VNTIAITADGDRTEYRPGEAFVGAAAWELDEPAQAMEVRLFWFTSGRGIEDAAVVQTVRFDRPGRQGQQAIRFEIPRGPYSFAGKLIALKWAIEAVALPGKASGRLEVAISPSGRAIILGGITRPSGFGRE